MQDSTKTLVAYWASKGVQLAPGCSPVAIAQFERRYHVTMPPALRSCYLVADGMKKTFEDEYDSEGFCFWPLENVAPLDECEKLKKWSEVPKGDGFFVFADYLHFSWVYAIRLSLGRSNLVAIMGKRTPELVGVSFEDFIGAYVANSSRLYQGVPFEPEKAD